jgi:hypothetical protein
MIQDFGVLWSGGAFVTGVETDAETGDLRMYVGHRYKGIYALVHDEQAKVDLQRGWDSTMGGHLMVRVPPNDALFSENERP